MYSISCNFYGMGGQTMGETMGFVVPVSGGPSRCMPRLTDTILWRLLMRIREREVKRRRTVLLDVMTTDLQDTLSDASAYRTRKK